MTSYQMLNQIKREMHNNPNFDTEDIIPEINLALEHIEQYTDAGKDIFRQQCVAGTLDYLIDIVRLYRIVGVWYGQENTATLGEIREGYRPLRRVDRKDLGYGEWGYWLENERGTVTPANENKKRMFLTFDPDSSYWLVVEYVPWDFLQDAVFTADTDLDELVPREIQSLIIERVVYRLKRSDGDDTFQDHKQDYFEKQERMESVHKEDLKYI